MPVPHSKLVIGGIIRILPDPPQGRLGKPCGNLGKLPFLLLLMQEELNKIQNLSLPLPRELRELIGQPLCFTGIYG